MADENGAVVKYQAEREAFPAAPEPRKCGYCAYRTIRAEGATAVGTLIAQGDNTEEA